MKALFQKGIMFSLLTLIVAGVCFSFKTKPGNSRSLTSVTNSKSAHQFLPIINLKKAKAANAGFRLVPPAPPDINGSTYFYFSAWQSSGSGSINADPNTLVAVTVAASGPPPGNYTVTFSMSGATFSDGSTSIFVSNSSTTKYFAYPSNHGVSWSGSFSEPNSYGSGSVSVQ
ncbi:MAG: hypothetical protein JWN76_572 [Chitinophagaceae bacterium]|nr:hypothetical protein [Chitinophagaceae bacterium]